MAPSNLQDHAARRLVLALCGILLFGVLAKGGWLLGAPASELAQPDPVLRWWSMSTTATLAVGLEVAILLWTLWSASLRQASRVLLWLAVVFGWYHLAAWWLGATEGCPCFGGLGKAGRAGWWAERILVGTFLAGAVVLFLLTRRLRQPANAPST